MARRPSRPKGHQSKISSTKGKVTTIGLLESAAARLLGISRKAVERRLARDDAGAAAGDADPPDEESEGDGANGSAR